MATKLDKYLVGRTLGKGAFAKVKLAQHSESGEQVAIKIMLQNKGTSAEAEEAMRQIMNEVEKLASLQHKYILNVVETAKEGKMEKPDGRTKDVVYVVLELAPGGEMFDFLMETGKFGEKLARFYFRQMIEGVYHIHQGGLTHRDLKPENILFDAEYNVKIADFGFAAPLEGNDGSGYQRTYLGTPFYMAPEIHEKKSYDGERVDVFALGIILFIMMAQNPPFRVADRRSDKLYQFMTMGKEKFFWKLHGRQLPEGESYFSAEFMDLFEKMMRYKPSERLTIAEILAHPWYQQDACTKEEAQLELKHRRQMIQAAKEKERKQMAAAQGRQAKAYRGAGDQFDETKLSALLEMERAIESLDVKPAPESTDALLFSKLDVKSFLEILYRKAHELGLEPSLDKQKYKLTLKTPAVPQASEEEMMERLFEPQDVELCLKFSEVKGEEGLVVADAQHVRGSRFDFRKVFMDLRREVADITE